MIKLLDTVSLREDRPDLGIRSGQTGAVVFVHDAETYEVEFVGRDGQTTATATLKASDISTSSSASRPAKARHG